MESFTGKLDIDLLMIYAEYQEKKEKGQIIDDIPSYGLSLRYQGDLSEIEKLGFKNAVSQIRGFATGNVKLDDIEKVTSHPGVLSLSYGSKKKNKLDKSVIDMKVRTDNVPDLGTLGVWRADTTTGVITSLPAPNNHTGRGVIVGIIDSGIDVAHPSFTTGASPALTSRILKYWDQGLKPADAGGLAGPNAALIGGADTYGVEFDKATIETFLNGLVGCPSRDCLGHGTHVAGIAAGNGNPGGLSMSIGIPVNKIGVAPEADLVIVKFLDNPGEIKDIGGHILSESKRMRDAFMYILQVAKDAGKPAVINCSFGSSLGPHDGLTEDEQFIDSLFAPAEIWYAGNIIVFAAGNDGGSRMHAEVTVPASGEIVIPYTLYDLRQGLSQNFENCSWVPDMPSPVIQVWYREVIAPADVSVQAKVPGDGGFSSEVFSGSLAKPYDRNKIRALFHETQPTVLRPDNMGSTVAVKRNLIAMVIVGNTNVTPGQHKIGLYELKINAPAGTVLQTYCSQASVGFFVGTSTSIRVDAVAGATSLTVRHAIAFKVNDPVHVDLDDGTSHPAVVSGITLGIGPDSDVIEINPGLPSPASTGKFITGDLPAAIKVEDRTIIPNEAGAKMCITVAAYNDNNGTAGGTHGKVADFSSRGPLADYSGLGPYAVKPDIGAPGVAINSALSKDMEGGVGLKLAQLFGDRWVELQGTSMAAPHITGLIALMLEKNHTLNVDQVRTVLTTFANNRDGEGPLQADGIIFNETFGGGLADGVKIINATP